MPPEPKSSDRLRELFALLADGGPLTEVDIVRRLGWDASTWRATLARATGSRRVLVSRVLVLELNPSEDRRRLPPRDGQ